MKLERDTTDRRFRPSVEESVAPRQAPVVTSESSIGHIREGQIFLLDSGGTLYLCTLYGGVVRKVAMT